MMLITVILIGLLYAIPNLYGEDPSLQITGARGVSVSALTLDEIRIILEKEHITIKSIALEDGVILVRFNNAEAQLHARELLLLKLDDKFIIAVNLAPASPKWLGMLGANPMKLGLDLRGGVHFVIEVDMETPLGKIQAKTMDTLRSELLENGIYYTSIHKINSNSIEVRFLDSATRDQAMSYIGRHQCDLILSRNDKNILQAKLSDVVLNKKLEYVMQQNITILRNRVNHLGITESLVQRQGATRIIVELPGTQDAVYAKEILGSTATLEFRLVNTTVDVISTPINRLPRDSEVKYTSDNNPIALYKRVILTGDHITDSDASVDEYNQPQVNLSLDNTAGILMSNFTKNNIGKPLATLLVDYKDNSKKNLHSSAALSKQEEVINVATIQSQFGSSFRITGIKNAKEARQLSLLLRAGALLSPIQIVEEHIIGPILGRKNITKGLQACLWALASSTIFMIAWYRNFGIIATTALCVNLILIVGVMSLLPGATLTMPGIAGIVLALAMAVDANVLINERIKEELKNGRSVQQAIHHGYKNAFSSIIDSNITTLITAIILFVIGTGPIKGFAITTIIGIATSMFTTIIGTRAIVNLFYGRKRIKKLSI